MLEEKETKMILDEKELMRKSLESTLDSIRDNVSRVLSTYFQKFDNNEVKSNTTVTIVPEYNGTIADQADAATYPTDVNLDSRIAASAIVNVKAAVNTTITRAAEHDIIYPNYKIEIRNFDNCSALFSNYTTPLTGTLCNWSWDKFLCWPPTPAGALAHMHCPSGWHGIDTRKFAKRKCELTGQWGSRPNETRTPNGWTDYRPCYKPEVNELMQQLSNLELFLDIAHRTRTLEIIGLILSLIALIISLIIFCNFRILRNNRTKIHKNLFIAMVLQVIVRLSLYLDQVLHRDKEEASNITSTKGIENTPYLCEASYILLEYARTAMFMWMFIEGWYLHNVVTGTIFQGRFPHKMFTLVGWGMPVIMTTIWAICTAIYHDSAHDCWWNYNLTPYYWILEGPRLIVILLNFTFLINIIRVLVVKLRESQASDIEQARKAVRAAIVLLPLLGITNLLQLIPDLHTPWKFALWSYVTHFLTSFQGFFIAFIYCFLNGEVRAAILKSVAVYMSTHGHSDWMAKRTSMYSGAYQTAADTDAQESHLENKSFNRNCSPPQQKHISSRKSSTTTIFQQQQQQQRNIQVKPKTHLTSRLTKNVCRNFQRQGQDTTDSVSITPQDAHYSYNYNNNNSGSSNTNWMFLLCFRSYKIHRVPPMASDPPESVVFELSEQ